MADVRQKLMSIRNEAAEYFADVIRAEPQFLDAFVPAPGASHVQLSGAEFFHNSFSSDQWASLTPEDRSRSEEIRSKLGHVIAKVAIVFQRPQQLGESAVHTLQQAVRQMDSALRFRRWEGSGSSTQSFEDHVIAHTPAWEIEAPVSASSAQSIFDDAIDRVIRLLQFVPSGTVVNDELGEMEAEGEMFTARVSDSGAASPDSAVPENLPRRGRPRKTPNLHPEVEPFLDGVTEKAGRRITIANFCLVSGFGDDTEFGFWRQGNTERCTERHAKRFENTLKLSPEQFLHKLAQSTPKRR
jgi:hypothetical protein